tara:strand:+ start:186 stop:494 length:309 start_codon:yes stop_codon:yes gene_type:complete
MPNLTRKKKKKTREKFLKSVKNHNRKKDYLKKGNKIQYNSSEGFFVSYATILDIHYDDKKPYYTIKILDDNREIQTEGNRLSEIPNLSPNKLSIIKKYGLYE